MTDQPTPHQSPGAPEQGPAADPYAAMGQSQGYPAPSPGTQVQVDRSAPVGDALGGEGMGQQPGSGAADSTGFGQFTDEQPEPPPSRRVEWQIVEQIPGDPFSADLVVWPDEQIEGVVVPLDDGLLGAVDELRRRQADVTGVFEGDPYGADYGDPEALPAEAEDSQQNSNSLWSRLNRSTGSSQADRWMEKVPVKFQIIGAAALLLVFALVMILGNLL